MRDGAWNFQLQTLAVGMRMRMQGILLHLYAGRSCTYAAGLPLVCRWSAACLRMACSGLVLTVHLQLTACLPPYALPSAWYVGWCAWLQMPVCLLECDLRLVGQYRAPHLTQYAHVSLYCSSITGGWLVTRCVCVVFRCTDGT